MNPMVAALHAGFKPSAPNWKKIGAIIVILVVFAGYKIHQYFLALGMSV